MEITVVDDTRSALGEGPVWDAEASCLWWVDIQGKLIHCHEPSTGLNRAFDAGERVGCLFPRASGGLILFTESGIHAFDPVTGTREKLADPEADLPGNRFNDGCTDRQGRIWAGTMRDDGVKAPEGSFYRLDADMTLTRVFEGFYTTNGLAFSPDGRRMYLAETHKETRTVWACAYDPETGTPGPREVFLDTNGMAGRPDGATVDAEGCYWLAAIESWQLWRITPEGEIIRRVALPVEKPTKCCFGGANLDTLYVTSLRAGLDPDRPQPHAGSLLAITGLGVTGLPSAPFGG